MILSHTLNNFLENSGESELGAVKLNAPAS